MVGYRYSLSKLHKMLYRRVNTELQSLPEAVIILDVIKLLCAIAHNDTSKLKTLHFDVIKPPSKDAFPESVVWEEKKAQLSARHISVIDS